MNKGTLAMVMMQTMALQGGYDKPGALGGPPHRTAPSGPRANPETNKYRKERRKKNKAAKASKRKNR